MQYQSFPGLRGSSESLEKLKALCLPPLQGGRFLDLGCNEGYFCGYARFDGAAEVIGIDRSEQVIRRARARFPECQFLAQSWTHLPEGKFDVILLVSALHYAEDQEAFLHRLMARLNEGGVLVLEIGIAPSPKSEWCTVKRSIDERLFPSRTKLAEILAPYAWKIVSRSVPQPGDPVARFVVHVCPMKPFVYLMMENPGAGKSTISRTLFARSQVPVVSGDVIYQRIKDGRLSVPPVLQEAVLAGLSLGGHDQAAHAALSSGLVSELVDSWCDQGGQQDFALDSYVPTRYRTAVTEAFAARGYVPVHLNWDMDRSTSPREKANVRAERYFNVLVKRARMRPFPAFDVRRMPSARLRSQIYKWHLDGPVHGQIFESGGEIQLAGWMLPLGAGPTTAYRCYLRSGATVEYFEFNRQRDDVRKAFAQHTRAASPGPAGLYGFLHRLSSDIASTNWEFGFESGGEHLPAARIRIRTTSSVNLFMARVKQRLRMRLAKAIG